MLDARIQAGSGQPVVAIIPARLGSTRFPGKVLANATGKTLIQHVCEAARRSATISRVVVATDDTKVADAVRSFGGECVLTSAEHPNGTSRLAEAAMVLGLAPEAIVVNVQGDEPEVEPVVIDSAVSALLGSQEAEIATVGVPFGAGEDAANPNIVKVVRRQDGMAMYFSRSLIPYVRDKGAAGSVPPPLRHVGLYVYRRSFLEKYVGLTSTPLERAESLEQLRALEHGYAIAVAVVETGSGVGAGIDTPEQYEAFIRRERARGGR